jgi:hypothetical protein
MQPFDILYSESALEELPSDSLVCPAYAPASVFQKSGPNEWVEPGLAETFTTAGVWEWMTGSYDGYIPDEEREVWIIYNAAHKTERPARLASTPDYATRVQAREPEMVHHDTLEEARTAIEEAIGDGVTVGHTNIWHRAAGEHVFRASAYIDPGTTVADFPWKSAAAVSM